MEQYNREELLHDFKSGVIKAFNVLFYLYYESLYHRCFKITRDDVAAQDVARDTLMKVWLNREKIETYAHLEALLFLNARNLSLNYLRNEKTRKEKFYDVIPDDWTISMVSNPITYNNVLQTIQDEIASMNSEDQRIADYLIFQELKPKEIAKLLDKNEQTIRNRKNEIWKKLKDALIRRDLFIWL